jgi:hypothetical protein
VLVRHHTLTLSPLATGGCGLETSIWPLRILFKGYGTFGGYSGPSYGTKLGAFRQRLGGSFPKKSKRHPDLSNIECASPVPSDGNACSTQQYGFERPTPSRGLWSPPGAQTKVWVSPRMRPSLQAVLPYGMVLDLGNSAGAYCCRASAKPESSQVKSSQSRSCCGWVCSSADFQE